MHTVDLNEEERRKYLVKFDAGLVKTQNGFLINGDYIFVMDKYGNFYLGSEQELKKHSSFFSAGPVSLAGHIEIRGGKVELFSNESGHYAPPKEALKSGAILLKEKGVFSNDAIIDDVAGRKYKINELF